MADDCSWERENTASKPSEWEKSSSKRSSKSKYELSDREKNKKIRMIYNEQGIPYDSDTTGEELREHYIKARMYRLRGVTTLMKQIKNTRNADVLFLVDITGSMQPYVDEVQKSIEMIVDSITGKASACPQAMGHDQETAKKIRLCFLGYRDHCDSERFVVQPFTESEATFRQKVAGICATGGGDGPEDVFGALDMALKQDWSSNSGTKVIFHIADAPCHGKMFHDFHDSYPDGDPHGLQHTDLFARLRLLNIDYYFGKITDHTTRMLEKFSEAYGEEIVQFDLKNVEKIREAVFCAVTKSVFTSIRKSTMTEGGASKVARSFTLKKTIPNWNAVEKVKGKHISFRYPASIEDLINGVSLSRKSPTPALIQVVKHPFAKGAERLAYYARDLANGTEELVAKESLYMEKEGSLKHEMSVQMQTIAQYLMKTFTEELAEAGEWFNIKFIKVKVLCLPATDGSSKTRFMTSELRLTMSDDEDDFTRFTNNTDYAMTEAKAKAHNIGIDIIHVLNAFSHWTYQRTMKYLMVVDLQGAIQETVDGKPAVLLTDPAIHCTDHTRFNRMNHGTGGMENFFRNHTCNIFCRTLKLTPVIFSKEED